MAAGPWAPQQLPWAPPERQQAPAAVAWQQRDAAVPWSLGQLLGQQHYAWPAGSRGLSSVPSSNSSSSASGPAGGGSSSSSASGPAGGGSSQPQVAEQRRRQKAAAAAAFQAAGWSRQEVVNVPNALSLARLLSGPLIASWILDGQASPDGCWA